ncbi:MAG: DNA polymerase Y family protein [Acidimicrobiales bacterium]
MLGEAGETPARALVAVCPDWAVIAAGRPPSAKVAVVASNRVVCLSPAARAEGAEIGLRRREAQARCPGLEILGDDPAVQARRWEPVVAAVEAFAPEVEVLMPGALALASRGPSRYFGGERALAMKVATAVESVVANSVGWGSQGREDWKGCCQVGVAAGLLTATVAAQMAIAGSPLIVPPGGSREFLAPLPVGTMVPLGAIARGLGRSRGRGRETNETTEQAALAALSALLVRLGTKTLGDFAALAPSAVLGRFGASGLWAHRFARGLEGRPLQPRRASPDWAVAMAFDPPAEQLHTVAFVAKALAEELHSRLSREGLVCTRLAIEAETGQGERLRRSWRHDGALSSGAIAERVRWQLEGWAQLSDSAKPSEVGDTPASSGITKLSLVPEGVRPDDGRQFGLWGQDVAAKGQVERALARVQGLLGPEAVVSAVLQGGRGYVDQVRFVTWGAPLRSSRSRRSQSATSERREPGTNLGPPWPGRLPGLAPALVHRPPVPAQVTDGAGQTVSVSSRGLLSTSPTWLVVAGGRPLLIEAWAGPWPLEERWWGPGGRRCARLQVCTARGSAYLLSRENGKWWVEATYD